MRISGTFVPTPARGGAGRKGRNPLKKKTKPTQPKNRQKTFDNVQARHRALDERIALLQQEYQARPTASRADELKRLKADKARLKWLLTQLRAALVSAAVQPVDKSVVPTDDTTNVVTISSNDQLPVLILSPERRVA